MIIKVPERFSLKKEKEDFEVVRSAIEKDAVFYGTNLWILFFAILIASLGLNTNSTAVVIGAMLISPLMGPIVGIGFGVAISDLDLLKKSFRNYLFAAAVGLTASTVYFALSPIDDAHSEILARTLPTFYDVLIALFGGFAGIIGVSSKQKGNVIPGVAIATALMPPLCTAGYGLATLQFSYFLGAFYLYLINSVFISFATIVTTYYLRFPIQKHIDLVVDRKRRKIIAVITIATLLPSIYIAYDVIKKGKYTVKANLFIENEAIFPNDYLLQKVIDPKEEKITLTFGGAEITKEEIEELRGRLPQYNLNTTALEIKQGFAFLKGNHSDEQLSQLGSALKQNEAEKQVLKATLDSLYRIQKIGQQVMGELKIQHPEITNIIIQPFLDEIDSVSSSKGDWLVIIDSKNTIKNFDTPKTEAWLRLRLDARKIRLILQPGE